MNIFLLTVSGVLFLLNYGLCAPLGNHIRRYTTIINQLRTNVTCDENVALFVPPQNERLDVTLKCFQNQLETIKAKCTVGMPVTLKHAGNMLGRIMGNKTAECKFANETVSYSSFLDKFKNLIQRYNSNQTSSG